jgi:transposase-like protein
MPKKRPELAKSPIIKALPLACQNETAAVEFLEQLRWGDTPCCVHCGSVNVYKMTDAETGERNKRFLWRCRDCKKQQTVRIGTVYEESRLPLRHWCYAFWAACSSKKGVSAMQIMRHCQISYKAALFMMHRVRFAMSPDAATAPKLSGTVECDEMYVGGKPRYPNNTPRGEHSKVSGVKRGRGCGKPVVFAMVERGGQVRAQIVAKVDGATLGEAMRENIAPESRIMTDALPPYKKAAKPFAGGHEAVNHKKGEYVRGEAHNNSAEGFFSLLKRGIIGTFHAVSRKHLHRYVDEFAFRYNTRKNTDGDRVVMAVRAAEGKRLMYRTPAQP